jgi:phosphoglycolate phosphatase-like HAD superfamily hydrolase
MIKLMVFDWNGVLIADTAACMAADNHVLEAFGGKPVDLKTYRETIIIPSLPFYTMHGADERELVENPKRWGRVFHDFYEERASKCRSRKNAKSVLRWLKGRGIPCVILSNHTIEGIRAQLKRLGLDEYISETVANPAKDTSLKKRNKLQKLEIT